MASGRRKLRSATSGISHTFEQTQEHEAEHDHSPPRQERNRRHERRQAQQDQLSLAAGGAVSDRRTRSSGRQPLEDEEEDEEAEAEDEENVHGAAVLNKRRRTRSALPRDATKRGRVQFSTRSATKRARHRNDSEQPVSDFALDGSDAEDEDSLLHEEAQHLIAEYESRHNSEQDGPESSASEQSEEEEIVLRVANVGEDVQEVFFTLPEGGHAFRQGSLEEFLALADDPLEGGVISSLWYQDADDNDADDDDAAMSSEAPSHDSDGTSDSASILDIDEAADQFLLMTGLASDSDSDDQSSMSDDGETTDSLDDGDELALIRFGIEVDEGPTQHWSLPATLHGAELRLDVDVESFTRNPEVVIRRTARKLGVDKGTAAKILNGIGLSVASRKSTAASKGDMAIVPPNPELGEFVSATGAEASIVIDGQNHLPAPSPFSARRSEQRRRTRRLTSGHSPSSARSRRPSMTSHSSQSRTPIELRDGTDATSASSSAASGEMPDTKVEMELEDVLHGAVLASMPEDASDGYESEATGTEVPDDVEATTAAALGQFDDLDRWDRIPIGAFRSSRHVDGSLSALVGSRRRHVIGNKTQASPVLLPVRRKANKGKVRSGMSPKLTMRKRKGGNKSNTKQKVDLAQRNVARLMPSPPRTRSRAGTPRLAGPSRVAPRAGWAA